MLHLEEHVTVVEAEAAPDEANHNVDKAENAIELGECVSVEEREEEKTIGNR